MDLSKSAFQYNTVVRVISAPTADLVDLFPNAQEVSLTSRVFIDYAECVTSAKKLLDEYVTTVNNSSSVKMKVGVEMNPAISGKQTISKDWGEVEVARFWVYDKSLEGEGNKIDAVAKTSIFAVDRTPQVLN